MKLSTLCSQLLPGEACDDIDSFLLEIDDFEEVPLVSRLSRIEVLLERLGPRWTSAYLLSLCNHVLSTVRVASRARSATGSEMFLALSFTEFELHAEEGVLFPHVFYYPGPEGVALDHRLRHGCDTTASAEIALVRSVFEDAGMLGGFRFCGSRMDGPPGHDVVRVFAVPVLEGSE